MQCILWISSTNFTIGKIISNISVKFIKLRNITITLVVKRKIFHRNLLKYIDRMKKYNKKIQNNGDCNNKHDANEARTRRLRFKVHSPTTCFALKCLNTVYIKDIHSLLKKNIERSQST